MKSADMVPASPKPAAKKKRVTPKSAALAVELMECIMRERIGAVEPDEIAACKGLIARGADPSAFIDGRTVLHAAIEKRLTSVAKLLITAGADVNASSRLGSSYPIGEATSKGLLETVRSLIKAGANVDHRGWANLTPLHQAAEDGNFAMCAMLIRCGAKMLKDNGGSTPLHYAAGRGKVNICELLLKTKVPVNEANANGRTALHSAAESNRKDACEFLLKAGADHLRRDMHLKLPSDLARDQKFDDCAGLIDAMGASLAASRAIDTMMNSTKKKASAKGSLVV